MSSLRLAALASFLILGAAACSSTADVDDKHQRIMVIHDEVMPMMPELRRLEKHLLDTLATDSTLGGTWQSAALELKQAQDMMWDWMNQYRKPETGGAESMAYLENQERSITKVSQQMRGSRETAKKLLGQ